MIVCRKAEIDEFHKLDWLMGFCEECAADTLEVCALEILTTSRTLKWKYIQ